MDEIFLKNIAFYHAHDIGKKLKMETHKKEKLVHIQTEKLSVVDWMHCINFASDYQEINIIIKN